MSEDPLEYLFGLEQFGIKFGLHNITTLVAALGHPERAFCSVHIAGTNGKGSVTAMVDAVLGAAGHRSARYTSPHLVSVTERFVIDGRAVSSQALADAVAEVREIARALRATGALEAHPTFFEVTTAAAFELFRRAGIDVAVCEVGMGGRLDATNVLRPMVTAITSIGLDHQQYLGTTLKEIAAEKAGIIKQGVPVVVGEVAPEVSEVIARIAAELDSPLVSAREGVVVSARETTPDGRATFRLRTPVRSYDRLELSLAGEHQVANAIVAVRILELLDGGGLRVPYEAVVTGLSSVRWPGRLERVRFDDGREVLLDAAHNPDGAAALARFLDGHASRRPLVFAAMRDKDARGILTVLAPRVSSVIVTRASNPRSAVPDTLAAIAGEAAPDTPVTVEPSPREALAAAWRQGPHIVVAGSIFLLGDVLEELGRP